MSLHLVVQRAICVTASKYIFLRISKRKFNSVSEAHNLSSFPANFQQFSLKLVSGNEEVGTLVYISGTFGSSVVITFLQIIILNKNMSLK